jgi:putative spermidine/putrescine transport system permease protein
MAKAPMTSDNTNPKIGALLALPLILFLGVMLGWPLVALLRLAGGSFDPAAWGALRNSLVLSAVVAILSTSISLVPAWVLARWSFRGKGMLRTMLAIPLTFSGIVVGFLAILMLGRVGWVPRVSEQLFGVPLLSGAAYGAIGLVLAYLYFEIPRAILALESSFRAIDVEYEAAAATLGLNAPQRMRRIILPLAGRSLLTTLVLTFSVALGSFGVALMLSRRLTLLPVEIYTAFTGFLDDERAALLALTLVAIAFATHGSSLLLRRAR